MLGRYHRVRKFGASGVSEPYIFDRGNSHNATRLLPGPYYKDDPEWIRLPSGVLVPAIRGGAGGTYVASGERLRPYLLRQSATTATQSTLALDSNYVNAASGDAIAARFNVARTEVLSKIYFFITSYTGTAANVNDINCEFRDNSNTTGPSSTLHDSVTVDPASATGWISGTWGTGFTLVAGTFYWAIVGDADGSGTDYATVLRNVTTQGLPEQLPYHAVQTTDGWASVRTFGSATGSLVLLFTSGRTFGDPITAVATTTSSTNQRGLRFVAPVSCAVYGVTANSAAAGLSGLNLWSGANGPNGSADVANGTNVIAQAAVSAVTEQGFAFSAAYPQITQGTTYRLVFTYAAAATTPSRFQIGTGTDATLRSAMYGGGNWYYTEANGTADWSLDNTSEFPAVDIILDDFVTASAGSGSGTGRIHRITDIT